MISRLIRSKPSVPHDIVRAELATPPMLVEALFQTVCFIQRMRVLSPDRLTCRAFEASRQLAESGEQGSWYSQVSQWFTAHGLDMERLPPFQYDPDSPYTHLSHSERNRVLRQDLWQLYIRGTWITPTQPLPPKMLYYRDEFMTLLADGFIQRPRYMDTYMPHSLRVAIGQLRVSSHRLEIETGRAAAVPRAERTCRVCREEVESEEHFVCTCRAYEGIRGRYESLFAGQPTLRQLMESRDQRQLGLFILEIQRYRETLLEPAATTAEGGRQSHLTDFFQRLAVPPAPTTPRGVTLPQAEQIRARRRPRVPGYRTPRLYHRQIQEIRTRHYHAVQERRARMMADPMAFIRVALAPDPPMYHVLHPHISTGWS